MGDAAELSSTLELLLLLLLLLLAAAAAAAATACDGSRGDGGSGLTGTALKERSSCSCCWWWCCCVPASRCVRIMVGELSMTDKLSEVATGTVLDAWARSSDVVGRSPVDVSCSAALPSRQQREERHWPIVLDGGGLCEESERGHPSCCSPNPPSRADGAAGDRERMGLRSAPAVAQLSWGFFRKGQSRPRGLGGGRWLMDGRQPLCPSRGPLWHSMAS
jgi:hypothetical protein